MPCPFLDIVPAKDVKASSSLTPPRYRIRHVNKYELYDASNTAKSEMASSSTILSIYSTDRIVQESTYKMAYHPSVAVTYRICGRQSGVTSRCRYVPASKRVAPQYLNITFHSTVHTHLQPW